MGKSGTADYIWMRSLVCRICNDKQKLSQDVERDNSGLQCTKAEATSAYATGVPW
jgi:hypothetical protein